MVCLGNICRSPIAEGILRYKVKENGKDWIVDSAGTESYHVGEAPHKWSQKVCMEHGIDISSQIARRFTAEDFVKYDKIYALAHDVFNEIRSIGGKTADMSRVDYLLNELYAGGNRSVPDPYYGQEKDYEYVFSLIDETCEAIIRKYK